MSNDRYHLILGRYIAKTTEIETRIDSVIGAYFRTDDGPVSSDFYNWVMARIEISKKVEILRLMAEFLDTVDNPDTKEMFNGLRGMMERRNELAHNHVMEVYDIGKDGKTVGEHLGQFHRKAGHRDPEALQLLDLPKLEAEIASLEDLVFPLTMLFSQAGRIWPRNATVDGVTTLVAGTLAGLEEKQDQRRAARAAQRAAQRAAEAAAQARKAERSSKPPNDA